MASSHGGSGQPAQVLRLHHDGGASGDYSEGDEPTVTAIESPVPAPRGRQRERGGGGEARPEVSLSPGGDQGGGGGSSSGDDMHGAAVSHHRVRSSTRGGGGSFSGAVERGHGIGGRRLAADLDSDPEGTPQPASRGLFFATRRKPVQEAHVYSPEVAEAMAASPAGQLRDMDAAMQIRSQRRVSQRASGLPAEVHVNDMRSESLRWAESTGDRKRAGSIASRASVDLHVDGLFALTGQPSSDTPRSSFSTNSKHSSNGARSARGARPRSRSPSRLRYSVPVQHDDGGDSGGGGGGSGRRPQTAPMRGGPQRRQQRGAAPNQKTTRKRRYRPSSVPPWTYGAACGRHTPDHFSRLDKGHSFYHREEQVRNAGVNSFFNSTQYLRPASAPMNRKMDMEGRRSITVSKLRAEYVDPEPSPICSGCATVQEELRRQREQLQFSEYEKAVVRPGSAQVVRRADRLRDESMGLEDGMFTSVDSPRGGYNFDDGDSSGFAGSSTGGGGGRQRGRSTRRGRGLGDTRGDNTLDGKSRSPSPPLSRTASRPGSRPGSAVRVPPHGGARPWTPMSGTAMADSTNAGAAKSPLAPGLAHTYSYSTGLLAPGSRPATAQSFAATQHTGVSPLKAPRDPWLHRGTVNSSKGPRRVWLEFRSRRAEARHAKRTGKGKTLVTDRPPDMPVQFTTLKLRKWGTPSYYQPTMKVDLNPAIQGGQASGDLEDEEAGDVEGHSPVDGDAGAAGSDDVDVAAYTEAEAARPKTPSVVPHPHLRELRAKEDGAGGGSGTGSGLGGSAKSNLSRPGSSRSRKSVTFSAGGRRR